MAAVSLPVGIELHGEGAATRVERGVCVFEGCRALGGRLTRLRARAPQVRRPRAFARPRRVARARCVVVTTPPQRDEHEIRREREEGAHRVRSYRGMSTSRGASGRPEGASSCARSTTRSGESPRTTTCTSSDVSAGRHRQGSRGRRPEQARGLRRAFATLRSRFRRPVRPEGRRAPARRSGIVRNRRKVESTVNNAARVLEAQEELGSSTRTVGFVDGEPQSSTIGARCRSCRPRPSSRRRSRRTQASRLRFVGADRIYAFMQTVAW